jgi:hypothetical protein
MERKPIVALVASGVALAVIAFLWVGFPPNPINPWMAASYTVGPAEHWWYSLPDAERTKGLYYLVVSIAALAYPVLVATAFIAWGWPLRTGKGFYPRRSILLAGAILVASAAWYLNGWHWGLRYQGLSTLRTYLVFTVVYLLGMALLWLRGRDRDSWAMSLAWHVGIFLWFCGFAFPWLGEMI